MLTESAGYKRIKEKNGRIATYLALAILPLSGFATDIYIPSLPHMGSDLGISNNQVQLTLSLFLISYGIFQLFAGSFIDSFGRYYLGLGALIVFCISCLVIATTSNIYLIYLMRIVHGVSIALIIVAKRAYFVDVFTGDQLKFYLSIFTIIWSAGPILAPFFGGYLQASFGWRSNFYFLAVFAGIIAVLEFVFSGETIRNRTEFNFSTVSRIYVKMIRTASFTLGLVMLGLSYSLVMVFNMTGSYIVEHHFSGSPVLAGYCSLISGLAWMTGGFAGKVTIKQPFYKKLVINLFLQFLFIISMVVCLGFIFNLYMLMFFVFIIHATTGYNYNIYFAHSLSRFPQNAGIAGGLAGGISYVTISVLSYGIVYFIPARDERNLSYSYLLLNLLSILVIFVVLKVEKKRLPLASPM
ncbi:MAG: MFS transporter [Chitinophagaceae bacterium]